MIPTCQGNLQLNTRKVPFSTVGEGGIFEAKYFLVRNVPTDGDAPLKKSCSAVLTRVFSMEGVAHFASILRDIVDSTLFILLRTKVQHPQAKPHLMKVLETRRRIAICGVLN